MWRTFRHPLHVFISFCISALLFFSITSMGSFAILEHVAENEQLAWGEKFTLLATIIGAPLYSITSPEVILSAIISLLIGINAMLAVFFIRLHRAAPSNTTTISSAGGLVAAFLGLGCAACGSLILTSFAASVGGLGILASLPLHGAEISYAAVALLVLSNIILVRGINRPVVCPI